MCIRDSLISDAEFVNVSVDALYFFVNQVKHVSPSPFERSGSRLLAITISTHSSLAIQLAYLGTSKRCLLYRLEKPKVLKRRHLPHAATLAFSFFLDPSHASLAINGSNFNSICAQHVFNYPEHFA